MRALLVGYFIGRGMANLVIFLFANPLRFLIGAVRIGLVFAALVVGLLGPPLLGSGGWVWVAMPIIAAVVLLVIQRLLRNLSDRL